MNHSVELISDKCIGCTDCIKRCPTEAIRIRNGKAQIHEKSCIDCGLCIKVCSSHAKKAVTNKLSIIKDYKYKVAIPAPTLYGQFIKATDINIMLTALKSLGFDEVFEVAEAAEMVTEATNNIINAGHLKKPIISSACPVIIRLISMNYPSLLDNIVPVVAPVEIAAIAAKNYFSEANNWKREDIGVFFISPCAAKATYTRLPLGIEKSEIDGSISIQDIFLRLTAAMSSVKTVEVLAQSTHKGVDWAMTGGESREINVENAIAVDGIENMIMVLEEIENGQLDADFIEGLACTGGWVGGPLTAINHFSAKNNLRNLQRTMKTNPYIKLRKIDLDKNAIDFYFSKKLMPTDSRSHDTDMLEALKKMEEADKIYNSLPKIDCGACGSPTCKALSEDIVSGTANVEDCIFMLRRRVKDLAELMVNLASKMPQTAVNDEKTGG